MIYDFDLQLYTTIVYVSYGLNIDLICYAHISCMRAVTGKLTPRAVQYNTVTLLSIPDL
jgi:hypothetical protein